MKKFEDFKEWLNKNEKEMDGDILAALKIYHEWLQKEALELDGKEIYRVLREEQRRTGQRLFV